MFLDTPDTIIAQLTSEGRNLLGRAKLGDVVYKQLGWQLGCGGYLALNPVKVDTIVDNATSAEGMISVTNNGSSITDWIDPIHPTNKAYVSLNGKQFIFGTHFTRGASAAETIRNIKNAILDSRDLRHYRVVEPIEDGDSLIIRSLILGEIGNSYPISSHSIYGNLTFGAMSDGNSASLVYPSWPIPPSDPLLPQILLPYTGTDGLIEMPTTDSLSFMSRVGENIGIGAYGELGLWVEVKKSTFPGELGRYVLFAVSHFPIQPKTDRTVLTFRVVIAF